MENYLPFDKRTAHIPPYMNGISIHHVSSKRFEADVLLSYFIDAKTEGNSPVRKSEGVEQRIILGEEKLKKVIMDFNQLSLRLRSDITQMPPHTICRKNGDVVWINAYGCAGSLIFTYWAEEKDGMPIGNLDISGKELHERLCRLNRDYKTLGNMLPYVIITVCLFIMGLWVILF